MAHIQVSRPLFEHLNETRDALLRVAIGASESLEESLPGFRKQLEQTKNDDELLVHCNGLEAFNESVQAVKRFGVLMRHLNDAEVRPDYRNIAKSLMDIADMDNFVAIRKSGISVDSQSDHSIAHLMEEHGDEFKQLIQQCIKQAPITSQTELRDRFNALFAGPGQRPGYPD